MAISDYNIIKKISHNDVTFTNGYNLKEKISGLYKRIIYYVLYSIHIHNI